LKCEIKVLAKLDLPGQQLRKQKPPSIDNLFSIKKALSTTTSMASWCWW